MFNPTNVGLLSALVIAFILGLVHGITPDEHTWPITFSYAVGSYSTKGGMKAGFIFSSGFTIQRAIMSEVAFFALEGVFITAGAFGVTYIFVGVAMLLAGMYIKNKKIYPHWHFIEERLAIVTGLHKHNSKYEKLEFEHKINPLESKDADAKLKAVPLRLAFLHGLIAGFGFGAFALIIYTVLSPAMPNAFWGWVPGALFGLGTMTMQIIFGGVFGRWLTKVKRLTNKGIAFVSRTISSDVLLYGGIAFAVVGSLILAFPEILSFGIITPVKIHNLHDLDVGFFIVIFVVVVISIISYLRAIKKAEDLGYTH